MAGSGAKVAKAERWTLDTQARFLEALVATCNVAKSLRAVGMGDSGVYRLRTKSPAFRKAWDAALREGYVRLELLMLERAINGTKKAVWHGGKKVGETIEHDPRLAMTLLSAHAKTVGAAQAREADERAADTGADLRQRFDEMADRMGVARET